MPIQNYGNPITELERRISAANNQLLDIRKRSSVALSALDYRDTILEKKVQRIEDFLSADITRFRTLRVSALAAVTGTIGGWSITAADIRNSAGTVKLRGAGNLAFGATPPTAANVGTGVFIDNTGIYGLNANTQNFTLSATNGNITAIAGTIGGWTLSSTALSNAGGTVTIRGAGNLAFGATPPTSATVGTGVFIDNTGIYGLNANTQNFTLSATNGNITAIAGTVGGWTLAATTLTGGNATLASTGILTLGTGTNVAILDAADATYRLAIGHSTYASAPFRVTKAGALTATSATITGSITATSGAIGGWVVDANSIDAPGGTITLRSAGNIAIGATPPTAAATGTGIFMDSTGIYGLNANTQEFYVRASDGKAVFGGGSAIIDSSGIVITGTTNISITQAATSGTAAIDLTSTHTPSAGGSIYAGYRTQLTKTGATAASALRGISLSATNNGAGTVTNLIGALLSVKNGASAGTTSNAYGVYADASRAAGTISNLHGFYFTDSAVATGNTYGARVNLTGTSTTGHFGFYAESVQGGSSNYGLYIGTMATTANDWAIYSQSATQSAHSGNLRIGSTTAPTVALDVTGSAKISTLTNGRVTYAGASGLLSDASTMTFDVGTGTFTADFIKTPSLTSGRVTFATTNGQLTDDADMTFDTATLTVTNVTSSGVITKTLTSGGSAALSSPGNTPGLIGITNDANTYRGDIRRAADGWYIATHAATTQPVALVKILDVGELLVDTNLVSTPRAAQTIGAGGTINLPTTGFTAEVTATAARTGVIIAAGSYDGQILLVFHSGAAANTLTMAAAGTSNVSNGVTCVLRGLEAAVFIWDSGAARWFPVFR